MSQDSLLSEIEVMLNGSQAPTGFIEDLLEATIENSLHLPDMATLVLYDQKLSWVDDARLAPGKALQVLFRSGKIQHTVFDGEIVEIEPNFDRGIQRLTIRARAIKIQAPMKPATRYPSQPAMDTPNRLRRKLATMAPTIPRMMFMSTPILLFMNISASQPAIPPITIAAIQPIPGFSIFSPLTEPKLVRRQNVR